MNFIINKEEYLAVTSAWASNSTHTAVEHILYNALRGHDLKRGFSPIQSANKLANGSTSWQSFDQACRDARRELRFRETHPTPRSEAEQQERFNRLNKRFGIIFTAELLSTLGELLA